MKSRILALLVAAALVAGGFAVRAARSSDATSGPGPAPTTRPRDPGADAVELLCSTEGREFCQGAADAFNARGERVGRRVATVRVATADTPTAARQVGAAELRPLMWLPTSSAYIDFANEESHAIRGSDVIFRTGEYGAASVAQSPVAIALWDNPPPALAEACGDTATVACLHQAAVADRDGVALAWGRPTTQADGLLTLALFAYTFYDQPAGLSPFDVTEASFEQFVMELVRAANFRPFDVIDAAIAQGPSLAGAFLGLEHRLRVRQDAARGRSPGGYTIHLPEWLVLADYPLAIIDDPQSSADDKDIGLLFKAFLLGPEGQEIAALHGLRPPGFDPELPSDRVAELPAAVVLGELGTLWDERIRR